MAFGRTRKVIGTARSVAADVKAAPVTAKQMGKEIPANIARSAGRRMINFGNNCKDSASGRHQARVISSDDIVKDEKTGLRYQLIYCRCCPSVMKAVLIGRK